MIPSAPARFQGTRAEYIARYLDPVLPDVSLVEAFHRSLVAYIRRPDAVFLVRALKPDQRGNVERTHDGTTIKWTDNAPAWWWHAVLFNGNAIEPDRLPSFIEATPCHMFQVASRPTVNTAGWHAAHVRDVKDRDTDWRHWPRTTAAWRFVRNIHPCNVFFVPKADWQLVGGDRALIASVAAHYRRRYLAIWDEYEALAVGDPAFEADAPDGTLVIDPGAGLRTTRSRAETRSEAQASRQQTLSALAGSDVWSEILTGGRVPPVGELLASHPSADAYTRQLLSDLTVQRLIAIADAYGISAGQATWQPARLVIGFVNRSSPGRTYSSTRPRCTQGRRDGPGRRCCLSQEKPQVSRRWRSSISER
jgi:hypothetical protein